VFAEVVGMRMRRGSVVLLLWLVVGALAAGQRHYFSGTRATCSQGGTIAVTMVAGPLNYLGIDPKISCQLPQPSK
jgi:hypothetical protein